MLNVKNILVTSFMLFGLMISNVTLTLENLDTDAGTVDVFMVNPEDAVGGFQFGLSGVTMTGGSGGTAASAGFTVSASASTLLAFSFSGATIPASDGAVLVTVTFENPDNVLETCIENSVFSDATGGGLTFTESCITLVEGGGCTDSTACNYDDSATVDDGSCLYPEPLEDCQGNFIGANVQIIHASPSPTVDVYVDGAVAVPNFEFETATPVLQLPTSFTVGIAPAGGDVIANFPFSLEQGGSYVVVATGILGNETTPFELAADATVFGSSFTDLVGLHVYHGSTDAPAVDILANGGLLIENLSYGSFSTRTEVSAIDYIVGVAPTGGESIADFTAPLSGLGGGSAVVFASGFLSGSETDPGFGLFAALQDGTVLELDEILPADVELQITDVTSDNIEVSILVNQDMGGFQFTLDSSCDDISWNSITAAGALTGTDFTCSVGATGVALGFSFTGATVAAGTDDVLANVSIELNNCESGVFEIAAATISDPNGQPLTVDLGQAFDYPAPTSCPDGVVEGCDGVCGSGSVFDDCGDCWTPYCYFGFGSFEFLSEDDCALQGGTFIGPNNPQDPFWNQDMDCSGECGGSAVEDCSGECGGSAVEDACGECGGLATDESDCLEFYQVQLQGTGVNQLVIFSNTITTLEPGDEIGVFDSSAIANSGDCSSTYEETLVGASVWTGDQLEVVAIGSVDNCAFGGFQLPGWVDGNSVVVKVYRPSTGVEYEATATYSAGTGTFGDLFMAISELELVEPNPPYYQVQLDGTGVNQLTILSNTITSLEVGDEIGIHDTSAITNSGDCSSSTGTLLVGAGIWMGEQMEIVSIGSVDNCAFGGFQLPGWVDGNSVVYNVYRPSTGELFNATATYSAGTGTFGDLFMAVSELTLDVMLDNDNTWISPNTYNLEQNYPNPFNPSTEINFDAGVAGDISLQVYDILGNKVKTLVNGFISPGNYSVTWDGTDNTGRSVSSGVYVYTLITPNETQSKRMLLVK
tara:strand:+ start:91 stop:3051 length:2961 start_codon:yes stop_codon:yes gene_type:complete